jgi:hypothetical protein
VVCASGRIQLLDMPQGQLCAPGRLVVLLLVPRGLLYRERGHVAVQRMPPGLFLCSRHRKFLPLRLPLAWRVAKPAACAPGRKRICNRHAGHNFNSRSSDLFRRRTASRLLEPSIC